VVDLSRSEQRVDHCSLLRAPRCQGILRGFRRRRATAQWGRRLLSRRRLSGRGCLADIDRTLPDTDPIGLTAESPPASELARRRPLARLLLLCRLVRTAWNRCGTPGQGPVAKPAQRECGEQNGS